MEIIATFVLGCRIGSRVLVAFRLLFLCQVKRPNLLRHEQTIGTLNAHAAWRGCAYVRVWVLGRPFLTNRHHPRFFF